MNMLAWLGCGSMFGLGLWISGMAEPAKVIGFLDVFGPWDSSLGLVMAAAVGVAMLGYRLAPGMPAPLMSTAFHRPEGGRVNARLVAGASVFGIGWGLGGYCPGPALTGLTLGGPGAIAFVVAMLAGLRLVQGLERRGAPATTEAGA